MISFFSSRFQVFKNFFSHFLLGEEPYFFLENLSLLLAAGIPILDAIAATSSEIRSRRLQLILRALAQDIDAGKSLSVAIERTGLYLPHVASLIRIGERSGRLVENLKVIAVEQKKERFLRSRLRSASLYPLFVLVLAVIIGLFIAWFILPRLALVFLQLKIELPFLTKILIQFGLFLGSYGLYAVPIFLLCLIVLLFFIFSFSGTKIIGEHLLFLFPGVKRLIKETEITRFGYLLGSLISAGLPLPDALHSLSQATSFFRYQQFYLFLYTSVSDGNSFKKSFVLYKKTYVLIPVPVQQLVIAGEQSGTLSQTLINIGTEYEIKTDSSVKDLSVILEPILLVIVWVVVVAIALAVILPIYGLLGGLQVSP
jgi:type II secretory pathway component PulF